MNREIKFEIKLKARESINGYKAGETVIIVNPIFDRNIGIAFFPISKNYDIVYQRQYTGLKDKNGKEIYDGDIIGDWNEVDGKMEQSKQTVYFDEMLGQWMLDNSFKQDRKMSTSLFSELQDFDYEVIGNIYENPELITN
ncbi:MAG: YopX family protein [Bacteroidota bacterium]|nr:YopX family protein [Bacteroidota bacterium]